MMKRISYLIFLIGLTILMYPQVMKLMADTENRQQLVEYEKIIETVTKEEIKEDLEVFQEYNNSVVENSTEVYVDPFIEEVIPEETKTTKVIKNNGAFGYLEIPKIQEILPIYLGATESNLAKGVAQMESTSIPIGGTGTNSVIAGHRGYYGADMFRYLDQLEVGDRIYIYALGMTLTYEVTGSEVIHPYQTEKLEIEPDKDQITLLTCTPYRVSTHRLIVHTRRIPNDGRTLGRNPVQVEYAKTERITLSTSPTFMTLTNAIGTAAKKLVVSTQEVSSNQTSEGYVDNVSSVARDSKIFTYAVVIIGAVLWIVVFGMFLGTFRKKKQA
ncbi:MAG: class C sortase [Clostridiaceae bacterium]